MKPNEKQARKNWTLFAILLGVALLLFIVTILRFGGSGTTYQ